MNRKSKIPFATLASSNDRAGEGARGVPKGEKPRLKTQLTAVLERLRESYGP